MNLLRSLWRRIWDACPLWMWDVADWFVDWFRGQDSPREDSWHERKRNRSIRLQYERLEERCMLSASMFINDVGGAENGNHNFLVGLTGIHGSVSVEYGSAHGTATGSDYSGVMGTLNFSETEWTRTISVPIASDSIDEENETYTITLSNLVGATFADNQATGTISDDDSPPTVGFDPASVTVNEADGTATFTVKLTGNLTEKTVTVQHATGTTGTATSGDDFTPGSGTLTFVPGDREETVQVPILNDTKYEGPTAENFPLTLSSATGANLGTSSATGHITDNDSQPTISITDVTVRENDHLGEARFTVALSHASASEVRVHFSTVNSTAQSGTDKDYLSASGDLVFAPGETSKTITVKINDDGQGEPVEWFLLPLSSPVGAAVADGLAYGNIQDDDSNGAPVFAQSEYTFSVPEDAAVTTVVGQQQATDPDGDTLVYSLTGGNGKFEINPANGTITVKSRLDYETNPWHRITVQATDPFRHTAEYIGRIVVGDVVDHPRFTPSQYTAFVPENAPPSTVVGNYTASAPPGQTPTYRLEDGFGVFAIDANGTVTVTGPLDFEKTSSYRLAVIASLPDGNEGRASVLVSVGNVDDVPVVSPSMFTFALAENWPPGTYVTTFTATDADAPPGQTLTWSLHGRDAPNFAINAAGQVTVAAYLDYEKQPSHRMTVQAKDADGHIGTATLIVNLTDVAAEPVFNAVSDQTVAENTPFNPPALITTVTATDPNGLNLTYSLSGGDSQFTINSSSGEIHLVNALNFAMKRKYEMTVRAMNTAGRFAQTTLTVNVTNANNHAPTITNHHSTPNGRKTFEFALSERAKKDQIVGYIEASDADGDTRTYAISGGNAQGYFKIETQDNYGIIKLTQDLPANATTAGPFVVTVSDSHSPAAIDVADVTFVIAPLVAITGDVHGVEVTGDTVTLTFVRYTNDYSKELKVTYEVQWGAAGTTGILRPEDFLNPDVLVAPGKTEGTVIFGPGQDRISITLLPKNDTEGEKRETLWVGIKGAPNKEYATPPAKIDIDDKMQFFDGEKSAQVTVLDGITLFGAYNLDPQKVDRSASGIDVNDINQGSYGDCWFLSAVGAIALRQPDRIPLMFNGFDSEGKLIVLFYPTLNGSPIEVKVDFSLDRGWSQSELSFDRDKNENFEVWNIMLEKAFFQWKGWAYDGWVHEAWNEMLNLPHEKVEGSAYTGAELQSMIETEVQAGRKLVITIHVSGTLSNGQEIKGSHAYIVEKIVGNEIVLINPHDARNDVRTYLPFSDLKTYLRRFYRDQ